MNKIEKLLICPDVHHPVADMQAWSLFLKAGKAFRPDETIILGDFGDFAAVSAHGETLKTRIGFVGEVKSVRKALGEVKAIGATRNTWITGNHEERLERYITKNAPELDGTVGIDQLLGIGDAGFKYYPYRAPHLVGNMRFVHDLSYAGKGAAGKSMEALGHNIVIGHVHRMEMQVGGTLNGERHVGASFGWLGDVNQIGYMSKEKARKDWTLGFGLGYHDVATGFVTLVPVPILPDAKDGYYCVVEGKRYSV